MVLLKFEGYVQIKGQSSWDNYKKSLFTKIDQGIVAKFTTFSGNLFHIGIWGKNELWKVFL